MGFPLAKIKGSPAPAWRRRFLTAAAAGLAVLTAGCGGHAFNVASPGSVALPNGSHSTGTSAGHSGSSVAATPYQPAIPSYRPVVPHFTLTRKQSAALSRRSGVTDGALFGGTSSLIGDEPALGRKLAIVRVYYNFGEQFPTPPDAQQMAGGRTLLLSLDITSRKINYQDIISGRYDSYLKTFLGNMEKAAVRYHLGAIYFCFEHEANLTRQHPWLGSTAQFVQAWDHIHRLAVSAHLDWNQGGRLHWVLILMHEAYIPMSDRWPWAKSLGSANAYFPGNSEVDLVAGDGYDSRGCEPGQPTAYVNTTPNVVFGPMLSWASSHGGIPVFVAEWGASTKVASVQLTFIQEMSHLVNGTPLIAGVLYWDNSGPNCTYQIGHGASLAAFKTMGQSPRLRGRLSA